MGVTRGSCQKLELCSCCCPGISKYTNFTMEFHFPNLGIDGGPWTVWMLDNYSGYTPDSGFCGPAKECCSCVCTIGFIKYASDGFCTPLYDTCQEAWPYRISSSNPDWDGAQVDFFLSCLHSGSGTPCNPPPDGHGADADARCKWDLGELAFLIYPGCTGLPGFPSSSPGDWTYVMDCETYQCICPDGFYLRMIQQGPSPIDPDFEFILTATDPGEPCPNDADCSEIDFGSMAAMRSQPVIAQRTLQTAGGPGKRMKEMFTSMGIQPGPSCQCNARMRQMDLWGVEGCIRNREKIISWLREDEKNYGWGVKVRAGVLGLLSGLFFNPTDPIPGIVDEAIRRARVI